MALRDWFTFDGIEIVNSARTFAYTRALDLPWVLPDAVRCDNLAALLGDTYTTPLADVAPWVDVTDEFTYGFAGMLVLGVEGLDDSTHQAVVTESIGDGGSVSAPRHAVRRVVFDALLLGDCGGSVRAGLSWLESILHSGDPCRVTFRNPGDHPELRFLTCCAEANADLDRATRVVYDAHLESGPVVTDQPTMNKGAAWRITFTLACHNPYMYGLPVSITDQLDEFDYEFMRGAYATYQGVKDAAGTYEEFVQVLWQQYLGDQWSGGGGSPTPETPQVTLPACFYDPACPPLPAFPVVSQGNVLCRTAYAGDYKRAAFAVGRSDVPTWATSMPVMSLTAVTTAHSDILVRFTPGAGSIDDDYTLQWRISHLPAGGTLVLDGAKDRIDLTCSGVTAQASHLVVASTPLSEYINDTWPVIKCGSSYTVSVDVRADETQADINIGFALQRRDF